MSYIKIRQTNPGFSQAERAKQKSLRINNIRTRNLTQNEPIHSGGGSIRRNQTGFSIQKIFNKRKAENRNTVFSHKFCIQCGKTLQQNQFQPFRTLFICKNDCVTTKNKQNIQKKRPIFHRPLHCCTFRGQFLTAVFLFLDILLKLRAVALRFTDLRQPLLSMGYEKDGFAFVTNGFEPPRAFE